MTSLIFRKITFLMAALLTPLPGGTWELPKESWQLSNRVFYLGPNSEGARISDSFIPLDRAPMVQSVIEADPLFERAVVHIKALNHPARDVWEKVEDSFIVRNAPTFPELVRAEGYDTYSNRANDITVFELVPTVGARDHLLSCSLDQQREMVLFCGLAIKYPPDPNIFVKIRLYSPSAFTKTPGRFRAIVSRIRTILACLDITEALKSDPAGLPNLLNFGSAACETALVSSFSTGNPPLISAVAPHAEDSSNRVEPAAFDGQSDGGRGGEQKLGHSP